MHKAFAVALLVAGTLCGAASGFAQQPQPTAAGIWEKRGTSGEPDGWFRIAERDGVYEGQIVKMFPKPGEDPAAWRCTRCEGEQKNAPVLGITFIKGMQRNGLKYENGTILDPRDGSTYSALMEVSPDGQSLTVRGYVGIALFGQSEQWHRLPDDALEPAKPQRPAAKGAPPQERSGRPAPTQGAAPR
jgi:uncharacterized protein (DUF2147 family)